ncbi:MAG TPA: twin-arginine translocase TatA/TatE family subunit [Acidimicrobiales bacterium]|nr:twin-arginine translocase TatA/TatE family subunit [Acidimicrobiales bacterium]
MFNLDPGKLIVIAVVAIILLGPDKLPQFARQVGGAWRTFNDFRRRMESEVRSTMPDLPPTSEIARLARSPSALLTHLSNLPSEDDEAPDGSFQPPAGAAAANGTGEGVGETGAGGSDGADLAGGVAGGASDGGAETSVAATNGKPAVAPQPADVAVPADPTLN